MKAAHSSTTVNRAWQTMTFAAIAGILSVAAIFCSAQCASAAQYVNDPAAAYDMRGFVSTATPLFGCGTGFVGLGQMTARAPSNLGPVKAYATFYVYTLNNSGQWVLYKADSPLPGGTTLNPGQAFTFPAFSMLSPAGYYWAYAQIDFHYANGSRIAWVNVDPTVLPDWNSTYRYQATGGYSYCYHY